MANHDIELARRLTGKCGSEGLPRAEIVLARDLAMQLAFDREGRPNPYFAWDAMLAINGKTRNNAVMVVPFVQRDKHFVVPGMKTTLRFNYCNSQPELALGYQKMLPEIPMVVANMVDGVPLKSESVDLLILNYGVLMELLSLKDGFDRPRSRNQYLDEVKRVVKKGGFVVVVSYDPKTRDNLLCNLANETGFGPVVVVVPKEVDVRWRQPGSSRTRTVIEDYIIQPEGTTLALLRK